MAHGHVISDIWFLHGYFAPGPRPEVENKWLHQSRKKIAVRLEAQRMNASNIYTKTNGKETSRPLISSKQPRPIAEIVDRARKGNTCFRMVENE